LKGVERLNRMSFTLGWLLRAAAGAFPPAVAAAKKDAMTLNMT
jgi:hypothetical protein